MLLSMFFLALGIALLYYGGEMLVDNAVRLAEAFKVTPLVIGLTVVAFGTSCPELAATITAAYRGVPDIAVGNVFGSNVANIALILGLSALVMPFSVTKKFLKREVGFMLFASVLVYPLMIDGEVSRWEGLMLFILLVCFIWRLLKDPSAEEEHAIEGQGHDDQRAVWLCVLGVAAGITLLVGGAQALIEGATAIAIAFGVPERVVGLTVVAFGTSLPELAASLVAARKKEGDIVLGNLVGSNIFNLLCILGLTSLVKPLPVTPEVMRLDYWVMLGISVLFSIFLATRLKVARWEGAVLAVLYFVYTAYLYLA